MINRLTTGLLCLVLTVSASPISVAADTLRPLAAENQDTRAGLEESLTGRPISRRTFLRQGAIAALGLPALPQILASAQTPKLPKATVTPTQLTLTLPPELVNQSAVAYLFIPNDQGYLQGTQRIPVNGVVTFPVPFSPPNRPGWLGSGVERVMALYSANGLAPATSTQLKIPGAPLVIRIAQDGTLSILAGTWPAPLSPTESQLAHLRQYLGPDKQIGTIAWDPVELLTNPALADFFSLAVRADVDTVWIGGFRFRTALSAAQRQALVDRASRAGVKTLGFADGAPDWAQQTAFVAAHYDELFRILAALRFDPPRAALSSYYDDLTRTPQPRDFGGLRIAILVDAEVWTVPGWDGNLGPYLTLLQDIILPRVRAFRDAHPAIVAPGPLVDRFEPPWLKNGAVTDGGATVRGQVAVRETALIGGTYGTNATQTADLAALPVARARAEGTTVQIGLDATRGQPYGDNPQRIGPDLLAVVRSLPPDQVGGVFIEAATPSDAARALTVLAAPLAAPLATSPDGRWTVRRVVAGGADRLEIWDERTKTLADRFALPAELAGGALYPQFPGNDYLLLLAQTLANGRSAFYVFGAQPGASGTTWPLATLVDEQGGRWPFVSRDGQAPSSATPVTIHYALPEPTPQLNKVRIEYAPLTNPTAPRTIVFTIVAPTGLEEEADQLLNERRLGERAVGELA